jgi:hypothetical protein
MYGKRKQIRGKSVKRTGKKTKRSGGSFRTSLTSGSLGNVYGLRTAGTNAGKPHIYDITAWFPILTTTAGTYSVSIALNFPGYCVTSGTWALMPNLMGSRARLFALYDEYRTLSVSTRIVSPNQNIGWVQTADTNDNFMYTHMDVDDSANATEAFMLNAGIAPRSMNQGGATTGVTTVMKNFSAPGRARQYFNNTLINQGPTATVIAGTVVPPEAYGSIKHLWPNLLATQYYGRLYATWKVCFRGLALA